MAKVTIALLIPAIAPLHAQAVDGPNRVLVAAAGMLRSRLPVGPISLEPRVVRKNAYLDDAAGTHSETTLATLRGILGGDVRRFDEVLVCGSEPRSCQLMAAVGSVAFSGPTIRGDTAEVLAYTMHVTGLERVPVAREELLLVLIRSGNTWQPIAVRVLSQT